jgi:hypothetical protein
LRSSSEEWIGQGVDAQQMQSKWAAQHDYNKEGRIPIFAFSI